MAARSGGAGDHRIVINLAIDGVTFYMDRRDVLKTIGLLLGSAVTASCERAVTVPAEARAGYSSLLSDVQAATAHRCVDLIIPTTDTPGALAAGVDKFIDYAVSVWFTDAERKRFIVGLDRLNRVAAAAGGDFVDLPAAKQSELLSAEEAISGARDGAMAAGDFFAQIKELTVVGYYFSEVGAKQELAYMPMPGYYDGFFKFNKVGKQWAS